MRLLPASDIARRLATINIVATSVALALACAILMVYDFVGLRARMLDNRMVQAQIVGVTTLRGGSTAVVEAAIGALRAAERVEAAAVYLSDGQTLATYYRDSQQEPLALPEFGNARQWHAWEGLRRLHVVRRVAVEGTDIGMVYIRSDLRELSSRLLGYGLIGSMALFCAIVASQLVGRLATRSISQPLAELAEVATRLAADRDYSVRVGEQASGEVGVLLTTFNEMLAQIQARDRSLLESHDELERRVVERTAALDASNTELEAFCYSVSHDLRTPLRSIDGFSLALLEDCPDRLDESSMEYLHRIRAATQRMGTLIDDLLALSRVSRTGLTEKDVDLTALATTIINEHRRNDPGRRVEVNIADGLHVTGDARLLRQALENLLGNAWKFTSKRPEARIEFGVTEENGERVFFVADNGAGFDQAYSDRLFGVFQRLHGVREFPGTGVGLAIVDRVVRRHGGRIWATGAVNGGALFRFTLRGVPDATAKAA